MADEMDEPRSAEEKATPDETKAEGTSAAATSGAENAAPVVEAAAGPAESAEAVVSDAAVVAQTSVDAESEVSTSASAGQGAEARTEERRDSHRPQAVTPGGKGPSRVQGSELDQPGLDLLHDVELDATLQFGSKEMLLRDVLELGPGDVVELDRHIAQPVDLVVGDRIVARGEVVVASGNFALRVTEVATPQMRLESIRCLF